jgi:hypothetical protein
VAWRLLVKGRIVLPILWPLLLLAFAICSDSLLPLLAQRQGTELLLQQRRGRLEKLRAVAVAGRIERQEYDSLVTEFGALTHLPASDPFRDRSVSPSGSAQLGLLITGLQAGLAELESRPGSLPPLEFLSVSPGQNERIGPFVVLEFDLNLRGRFHAIGQFMQLLDRVGRQHKLMLSVGVLRVESMEETASTGEEAVTVPVRAYLRE